MKFFINILFLLTGLLVFKNATSQNVAMNMLTQNSSQVNVGGTVFLEVTISNTNATSTVGQYRLKPIFTVPSSVVIPATGHILPSGWTILNGLAGQPATLPGQVLRVSNGTATLGPNTSVTLFIALQGVTVAPSTVINGALQFSNGVAPGTGNGTLAGNNTGDDNPTATVEVLAAAACNLTGATVNAPPIACGATTTTLTVTPTTTGATGTLEYSINGGAFQSANTFTVAAGAYTATVREVSNNACNATSSSFTVNAAPVTPAVPTASAVTQPTCAAPNGSFTITNYSASNTYTFSPSVGVTQTGANVTAPAGTYTVTATLGTCTSAPSSAIVVNAAPNTPAAPTASTTQPTCTVATGTITVTSAISGLSFSIDGTTYTNTTGVFTNVTPGTYSLTARNAAGCTSAATSVTINAQPATPAAPTASTTQPTCAVATGTITVTSATSGLSFSIDGTTYTNTTGVFTNVTPGTYSLTARNAAGCTSAATSVTLNAAPNTPTAPTASTTQPTCTVATGTITVTSATSGLSFSIDGTTYTNTTGVFTNVAAGTYSLTARNAAGCTSAATSVTINAQPATPAAPGVTVVNSCTGNSTLTATGVTGSVLWSNGATTISITVASIPATTYTVTQTVGTCTSTAGSGITAAATGCNTFIADPALGQLDITNLSDVQQNANALLFPPTYKLKVPFFNLDQVRNTPNGTIKLEINLGSKLVLAPGFNLATAPLNNYFTWTSAIVSGKVVITGTQNATIPEDFAGIAEFSVKGSASCASTVVSKIIITNISATLIDQDLQNNDASLQYTFPITLSTTQVNVTCNGLGNGIINIVSSPGLTSLVTRNASTNAIVGTTNTVTGLAPGTYIITATATGDIVPSNTCTNSTTVSIVQPTSLSASLVGGPGGVINNVCNGGSTGSFTVAATGGTAPYTYTISGPTVNTTGATTGIFTGLLAGTYTVTATDANGCTTAASTFTVVVTQPTGTAPDISLGSDITGSLYTTAGTSQTIVYNVTEIAGNAAVGDTIRITKPAGFTISFNNALFSTTVGGTNYVLDNARWKIDNSNPAFTSIILTDPNNAANPGTLLCNQRVNVAVTLTRNTSNILTFTLSARLRRANGELNLNNNLNSIILTAE